MLEVYPVDNGTSDITRPARGLIAFTDEETREEADEKPESHRSSEGGGQDRPICVKYPRPLICMVQIAMTAT